MKVICPHEIREFIRLSRIARKKLPEIAAIILQFEFSEQINWIDVPIKIRLNTVLCGRISIVCVCAEIDRN